MKFLIHTEFGELLNLAIYLHKVCKHEVLFYVKDEEYKNIGEGIVPKIHDWHRYLGLDYTWVFDSCNFGDLQDWLRESGEAVFGGCAEGDKLENDRQLGQKWFKGAGFYQVPSHNFTDIDKAIEFVQQNFSTKWILKQNGDAPKHISYATKFDGCTDLIYHLEQLQHSWNEAEYGKFDCDLMEIVEGLEIAASAFFNGHQFMENSNGQVVGFLNCEEKKEGDGGTGETCGEMGTTFFGVTEKNRLFKRILLNPTISDKLKAIGFRGVFNINCIVTDDDKIVALEPTMRPGIPATSYEFIEGVESGVGELIDAVARGLDSPIELYHGVGMVMCVVAKPFPLDVDVEEQGTSLGQKLWIIGNKEMPHDDFSPIQQEHIHLYNFQKQDGNYRVASKNGYLLTVTRKGLAIKPVRNQLVEYIKSNLYVRGMKYRTDIGKRVEEVEDEIV